MKIFSVFVEKIREIIQKNGFVFLLISAFVIAAHGIGVFNGYTWDDNYLMPKAERLLSAAILLSMS
ncbi:MAG: hypothetical protein AB1632_05585 [Nitrospirota bacterium]